MEVESLAGPAGVLVLGGGVITWLVRELQRYQTLVAAKDKLILEKEEARRADWRAQAEMNLTNQRALDKATMVMERLAQRRLSPAPTSTRYHRRGPGSST